MYKFKCLTKISKQLTHLTDQQAIDSFNFNNRVYWWRRAKFLKGVFKFHLSIVLGCLVYKNVLAAEISITNNCSKNNNNSSKSRQYISAVAVCCCSIPKGNSQRITALIVSTCTGPKLGNFTVKERLSLKFVSI